MSWRIGYWRGSTCLRDTTVENATQDDAESLLRRLATNHFDLEYLRASEADTPDSPEIHSNRTGTMLWTTGRDFHYTADDFLVATVESGRAIGKNQAACQAPVWATKSRPGKRMRTP